MGLLGRIKKRLPIVGAGSPERPIRPASRPAPPSAWRPEAEEPASPRGDAPVRPWIEAQVREHAVTIFMKGSPEAPACGFSANASAILASYGRPFHHVDVLLDDEVREDVKAFSGWPTLPQIYIGGEFVGGNDILVELHQAGELRALLEKAWAAADGPPEQAPPEQAPPGGGGA